jgi:hypothetical protein
MVWETIVDKWRGRFSQNAIAEAVRAATQAFVDYLEDYAVESIPT